MPSLKKLLQLSVLAVCALSSTVVFAADELAVIQPEVAASNPAEQPEASALPQEIDFGALFTPEPVNKSCTANSQCTPVGGTPISCVGVTTCSSAANWVICDGVMTPCTCNPANVPTCYDPVGFCQCWSAAPAHAWGPCRQAYCIEP